MAEAETKQDKPTGAKEGPKAPKHAARDPKASEEALKRRERITLILLLVGAVVIVAGMFLISSFLSGS